MRIPAVGKVTATVLAVLLVGPAVRAVAPASMPLPNGPHAGDGIRMGYVGGGSPRLAVAVLSVPAGIAASPQVPAGIAASPQVAAGPAAPPKGADGPDGQADGRGGALVWVSTRSSAEGDLFYLAPGATTPVPLAADPATDQDPALSPDGKRVAFASDRAGGLDLWVVNVDGTGLTRVTDHPADDNQPSWSRDGTRLVFTSTRDDPEGDLYAVSVAGGAVTRLTATPGPDRDPAWSPAGDRIAFTHGANLATTDIVTMPASGGPTTRVTPAGAVAAQPSWAPAGDRIAYTSRAADPRGNIFVVPASGGAPVAVAANADAPESEPTWLVPPGSEPTIVYSTIVGPSDQDDIWSVDVFGRQDDRVDHTNRPQGVEKSPSFSKDGTRLAYTEVSANGQRIMVADADGRNARALTEYQKDRFDDHPDWSPDGTLIAFDRLDGAKGHPQRIVIVDVKSTAPPATIGLPPSGEESDFLDQDPTWSADGTRIAFTRGLPDAGDYSPPSRIWFAAIQRQGNGAVAVGGQTNFSELVNRSACSGGTSSDEDHDPAFPPFGSSIAFMVGSHLCTAQTDGSHVNVIEVPDGSSGIGQPAWTPGGDLSFTVGCVGDTCRSTIWLADGSGRRFPGSLRKLLDLPGGVSSPTYQTLRGGLSVSVSVSPQPARADDEVRVTYTVQNTSALLARRAWLVVDPPGGLALAGLTPSDRCTLASRACLIRDLRPQETFTATATVHVGQAVDGRARARAGASFYDGPTSALGEAPFLVLAPSTAYRITYVSADTPHLVHSVPGSGTATRVPAGAASEPDTEASARGSAVVWVSRRAAPGTTEPDGDLFYLAPGATTPVRLTNDAAVDRHPVLAPDGKRVAFASSRSGNFDLWLVNVDGSGLTRLTDHPADDNWPSWSPDGTRLVFTSNRDDPAGALYTLSVSDHAVTRLTSAAGPNVEPAWSPDGTRIAFRHGDDIATIPAAGGAPTRVTPAGAVASQPSWSPESTSLAYTSRRDDPAGDVYTIPIGGGTSTPVGVTADTGQSEPTWWKPPGGGPAEVVYTLVTEGGGAASTTDIWSADPFGRQRHDLTNRPGRDETGPAYALDGTRLAYNEFDERGDSRIVIANADGGNPRALTPFDSPDVNDLDPTWSPDATMIAFTRLTFTDAVLTTSVIVFVGASDGVVIGQVPMVAGSTGLDQQPAWSPTDSTKLAISRSARPAGSDSGGDQNIWLLTLKVTADQVTVTSQAKLTGTSNVTCQDNRDAEAPAWSPGGTSIAFVALDEGFGDLCVIGADGRNPRSPIDLSGAGPKPRSVSDPAWSPDGAMIAFGSLDGSCSTSDTGSTSSCLNSAYGIWAVSAGGGVAHEIVHTPGGAREPAFQTAVRGTVTFDVSVAPAKGYVGGDPIVVSYMVHNAMSQPVTAVWLTTATPVGLPVRATSAQCGSNGGTLCGLGTIPAGATVTVTVTLSPEIALTAVATGHLTYTPVDRAPATADGGAPVVVIQPVLTVDPPIGPPGFVTIATGTNFPPGTVLRLVWQPGISAPNEITVDATGGFRAQVLVFHKDRLGLRTLVAVRIGGTAVANVVAGRQFLVVPGTQAPPNFPGRG